MNPSLAELLRWMLEMPEVFRLEPLGLSKHSDGVSVAAVVADLHETLLGERPAAELLRAFQPVNPGKAERNRLRFVLAASHLLWHPGIRHCRPNPEAVRKLLLQDITDLAAVTPVDNLQSDEERREELVRRTLATLGLRLPGESEQEAADRLVQVDSVERIRLLREAAEKEKRAREVREMMAKKAAEEAAAKVSRE